MNNLRVNESMYLSDLVILKCIKERLKELSFDDLKNQNMIFHSANSAMHKIIDNISSLNDFYPKVVAVADEGEVDVNVELLLKVGVDRIHDVAGAILARGGHHNDVQRNQLFFPQIFCERSAGHGGEQQGQGQNDHEQLLHSVYFLSAFLTRKCKIIIKNMCVHIYKKTDLDCSNSDF